MEMEGESSRLFVTERGKGRRAYCLYASSILVNICTVWIYRATHAPIGGERGRWEWIGLSLAELWFGLYWILTQTTRWNPIYRHTFIHKLSQRYEPKQLPGVDIFVCTADPNAEPPSLVISTVLSVMAYDYPPEKLSVYLSDDACSVITFFALFEASRFAKHWITFCRRNRVEPRSPAAYFSKLHYPPDTCNPKDWSFIKKLYEEMFERIESVTRSGEVPTEVQSFHKGFSQWKSEMTPGNHDCIVQVLIDGKDQNSIDQERIMLPTLVYMAREKRPEHNHNFKAGAMNALIRVSSVISNGPVILNVDCDMYSNNSECIKEALCILLDEKQGHDIAFVQYPQDFENITSNDIYGNSFTVNNELDSHGMDGLGGHPYIGTGCFHRRQVLCGRSCSKDYREDWNRGVDRSKGANISILEDRAKSLATCTYEINTQWGNQIGLKYGCPVEDVITGLLIKCRGWRSAYCNPKRRGFLGLSTTTLEQTLVQYKRWGEGNLQIFLSKHNAFLLGRGKIKLGLMMTYSIYGLWAPLCFPTLYYVLVPSLCFLRGISLFPSVTNIWSVPFIYIFTAMHLQSLIETLKYGGNLTGWWNYQRMWIIKRITSFLFASIDTFLKYIGVSKFSFAITAKSADKQALKRYEQGIIEFSSASPFFIIISTVSMINMLCFVGGLSKLVMGKGIKGIDVLFVQLLLSLVIVGINLPIYEALFVRKDRGSLPFSVTLISLCFVVLVLGLAMIE